MSSFTKLENISLDELNSIEFPFHISMRSHFLISTNIYAQVESKKKIPSLKVRKLYEFEHPWQKVFNINFMKYLIYV